MQTIHLLDKNSRSYCGMTLKRLSVLAKQSTTFEDWCDCKKCLEMRLKRLNAKAPEPAMDPPNTDRYSGERLETERTFNARHGIGVKHARSRDEAWVRAS